MKNEFNRFGISSYRSLTGWLEILGGAGLLFGFFLPWMMILASGGLVLLMFLGLWVRIKVKDHLIASFPAFILMCINLWIFLNQFSQ